MFVLKLFEEFARPVAWSLLNAICVCLIDAPNKCYIYCVNVLVTLLSDTYFQQRDK